MFQNKNWSNNEYLDVNRPEFSTLVEHEETRGPVKKRKLDNEQQTITSNNKEDPNNIGLKFNGYRKLCFKKNTVSLENGQNLPDSTDDCNNSEIELQKLNSYPNKSLLDNTVFDVNDGNGKSIVRKDDDKGQQELEDIEKAMNEKINDNAQDKFRHLEPSTSSSKGFLNNMKPPSSMFKRGKHSSKKITVVRKFPGPAGLLPDFINAPILPTSRIQNSEDSKDKGVQYQKDYNLADYCSQNTTALFSGGAWQIMLNDLPPEFLNNYEIAEIKRTASANRHQCTKIPFLAGIIQSINFRYDNPIIVLRDFTGQIEGTIHEDILTKYPGSLEKDVVILLQNVGLLCISGTFAAFKYHILISPSNLLAIYSDVRDTYDIIRTPHMELLQKKLSKTDEFNSSNLFMLRGDNYDIEETNCDNVNISQEDSLSSEKDGKKTCKNQNQSHNSNIDTNSNEKHLLPSSQTSSSNTNTMQNKGDIGNAATFCRNKSNNIPLQNIDKMMINKNNASLKSNVIAKENKEDRKYVGDNESLSPKVSTDAPRKYLRDQNINCNDIRKNNYNKYELSGSKNFAMFNKKYVTQCERNISRNKDPPTENVLQNNNNNNNKFDDKQMPSINNNWAENILCDTNDDSDDEMLSQLDMDVDSLFAYDDDKN